MGLAITCFCRLALCTLDPLLNHTLIVVCRLLQSLKLDHKRQHTLNIQSRTKHILSTHQKNPVARIKISATRKRWVPPEQFLKSFVKMKSENGGELGNRSENDWKLRYNIGQIFNFQNQPTIHIPTKPIGCEFSATREAKAETLL